MLWDGLGFFGTGHHKLDRLEGVKFRWWHKMYNLTEMSTIAISFSIMFYIFFSEFVKLGTIKLQFSSLVKNNNYTYQASEIMPMHGIIVF